MNLKLGFSTGALHKHFNAKEALNYFQKRSHTVVEIGLVKMDRIREGWADSIEKKDLEGFDYVSLHAPVIAYGENEETKFVFEKIKRINQLRKLDAVVVHPNTVENFNVFSNVEFVVAFENMDNRKDSYTKPEELKTLLDQNSSYRFILDVNHAYTHDKSMEVVKKFYSLLGDRIEEIHLSGYEGYHEPLFKTKQMEILKSIQNFETPIIIEAVMNSKEIEMEMEYVLKQISEVSEQRVLSHPSSQTQF